MALETQKIDNRLNELYDELFAVVATLTHFLNGLRDDLAANIYTPETAERDLETLTYYESMAIESVLADIVAVARGEEE